MASLGTESEDLGGNIWKNLEAPGVKGYWRVGVFSEMSLRRQCWEKCRMVKAQEEIRGFLHIRKPWMFVFSCSTGVT